ncbi:hypothetical protein L3Q82_011913 [Scortum barcoo]|uniref:Uncharacterized protein n=1 Tax=Scortum barcoo TaxID=214431 RepID=A0ACB8W5K5_9TELE|nr:hypothetical protein L3Q82_011913 [Scortum barcoo]
MFEHKGVHQCTWHQDTLGRRSMIDFVVVSSDLRPYVLDTRVKRGAELSTDHHLVVSWIRWQRRKLDRPGRPKCIVRVCWERLAEPSVREVFNSHLRKSFSQIPREAGDIESEWTMFSASIVDAAGSKLWTQGLWCLSWRQPPNPVVDTGIDRYRQAKQAAARTVLEAKTRVWEEFGEAMEEDYRSASKRFWQTVRRLRRGKQYSANTVYSAGIFTLEGLSLPREGLLQPGYPGERQDGTTLVEFRRNNVRFRPGRGTLDQLYTPHRVPSTGCLRVYGSLPNQSTCGGSGRRHLWRVCPTSVHMEVLVVWRRHSHDRVPRVVFWWGPWRVLYGVREPLLLGCLLYPDEGLCRSRAWFALPAVSQTCSQCMLDSVPSRACPVVTGPVHNLYGQDLPFCHLWSQGPEGVQGLEFPREPQDFISASLILLDDVVLMASSGQDLQHSACTGWRVSFASGSCSSVILCGRFAGWELAGMRISTSKSGRHAMVLDGTTGQGTGRGSRC